MNINKIIAVPAHGAILKFPIGAPLDKDSIVVNLISATGEVTTASTWDADYNPNKIGIQKVPIRFRNHTTYINVEVVGSATQIESNEIIDVVSHGVRENGTQVYGLPMTTRTKKQTTPKTLGDSNDGGRVAITILSNGSGFYAESKRDVFTVGQRFDISDFALFYVTANGSLVTEVPVGNWVVLDYATAVAEEGNRMVTVAGNYAGQRAQCCVFITVGKEYKPISGLRATPSKTNYSIGEAIDKSTVAVTYNGTNIAPADWEYSGMDSSSSGAKVITVYYDTTPESVGGVVFTTFTVTIGLRTNVISAVTTKNTYRKGEPFDYGSLKVTLHAPSGDIIIPSNQVRILNFNSSDVGKVDPMVEYKGMTAPINVIGV
jgi:hypothetical protein